MNNINSFLLLAALAAWPDRKLWSEAGSFRKSITDKANKRKNILKNYTKIVDKKKMKEYNKIV